MKNGNRKISSIRTKAKETIAKFDTAAKVDAAFAELRKYWDNLLSIYTVDSGDEKLDRMVNIWNQYQCMITFCFSRSASFFERELAVEWVSAIRTRI